VGVVPVVKMSTFLTALCVSTVAIVLHVGVLGVGTKFFEYFGYKCTPAKQGKHYYGQLNDVMGGFFFIVKPNLIGCENSKNAILEVFRHL